MKKFSKGSKKDKSRAARLALKIRQAKAMDKTMQITLKKQGARKLDKKSKKAIERIFMPTIVIHDCQVIEVIMTGKSIFVDIESGGVKVFGREELINKIFQPHGRLLKTAASKRQKAKKEMRLMRAIA